MTATFKALFRREFLGYFRSPVAYVFIVIFLLATGGCAFFLGQLFESNQASMDPFFAFLPWLYLVLVPAVGMRLWAEERRTGTIELLFTLPVTIEQAVVAKFLAGWAFLAVALFLTFPIYMSIVYLGPPDHGVIFTGYLGALLMAGSYLAVTCWTSALSRNQVISFILSAVVCFVLVLVGWGVFASILPGVLPAYWVDVISNLGFISHFQQISRGVVDFRDLIYFGSVIGSFLAITVLTLRSPSRRIMVSTVAAIVVLTAAANFLGSRLLWNLDLTQDRLYSLTDGSRQVIAKTPDGVEIKFYYSRSVKDLAPGVKVFAVRVEELLKRYAKLSSGKITFVSIDPKPDTDDDEAARKAGLSPLRLPSGDELFLGAVFQRGDKEVVLAAFDPRREEQIEYDISETLFRLQAGERKKAVILSSLPVMGGGNGGPPTPGAGAEAWIFVTQLRKTFDVEEMKSDGDKVPSGTEVLLVIHPKNLPEKTLYAIDQYVVRGGRAIVLVDPFSRYELSRAGQQARMMGQLPQVSSDLKKLFESWGVEYHPDQIVGDTKYQARINTQAGVVSYPLFLALDRAVISRETPITNQLSNIVFAEGGEISLKEGGPLRMQSLIVTSAASGSVSATLAGFMGPEDLARELKPDGKVRTLAGIVSGKFKSAFSGTPPEMMKQGAVIDAHQQESVKESSILIMADTDFVFDENAVQKFQFGNQVLARPTNDNLAFLVNAAEFLAGSQDLIGIRSKGRIARPFTRIMDIQRDAQAKWKEEEDVLNLRLQELQKKLSELQAQRSEGNRMTLTAEQQSEIDRFRKEEVELRQRRRLVRKNLREDIEKLGKRLVVFNLTVMPAFVSLFGIEVFRRRRSRMMVRMQIGAEVRS